MEIDEDGWFNHANAAYETIRVTASTRLNLYCDVRVEDPGFDYRIHIAIGVAWC